MNFIINVFGANLLILLSIFSYIIMCMLTLKNVIVPYSSKNFPGLYEDKLKLRIDDVIISIFSPFILLFLLVFLISKEIYNNILKFPLNKMYDILPTIKIEK